MTNDTEAARIARLRATRDRLEAQLADPGTPAYSIAPLSNQLRLTDKELDRIQRAEDAKDDGLPTTPDDANLLHFFQYRHHERVGAAVAPRRSGNAYLQRQTAIYDSWHDAGFIVPEKSYPSARGEMDRDIWLAAVDAWVEECRAELARCLANHHRTP
jgi:hypothetical protein